MITAQQLLVTLSLMTVSPKGLISERPQIPTDNPTHPILFS